MGTLAQWRIPSLLRPPALVVSGDSGCLQVLPEGTGKIQEDLMELLRPEVKEAGGESVAAGHLQCIDEHPPEVTATQNLRRDHVFANRVSADTIREGHT